MSVHFKRTKCRIMHFSPIKSKFYRDLKDRCNHIKNEYVKGKHHMTS